MPLKIRTPGFIGWLRASRDGKAFTPWEAVCEAGDYWDCWGVLYAAEAGAGGGDGPPALVERVVLRAGDRPDVKRKVW
jgi:hypothetical protein